jgi:glycosyltransferase involved in cell wall biosynthesis
MLLEGRDTASELAISRRLFDLKELVRPYYLKWLYFRLKRENCPHHFKNCWRFPTATIDDSSWGIEAEDAGHRDVVFLPMADWHTCVQRTQHFATTFALLGHRCFYVNPHLGREFPNTYSHSPRVLVTALEQRVHELHVHLLREPVFHHRCLRPEENQVVVREVERLLRSASSPRPLLIVSFPLWGEVALELRERLGCRIIYDCHDLLAGFGNISEDLLEAEGRILSRSDLVVFSARWLMEHTLVQHPAVGRNAVLVRNAANHCDFQAVAVSHDHRNGSGTVKTIGYVGALNFWFDTESVKVAALAHPEWRFVLIGPVGSRKLDVLRSIPNIFFRGEVPYADLASHLSEVDVAIIPFLKSPLTMATNPIKLYEYFACGLPVVSARLPEVEQFPDLVYFADSPEQFSSQIEMALRERDSPLRARRVCVAQRESWLARCTHLSEEIRKLDRSSAECGCRATHE